VDYVLEPFSAAEQEVLAEVIDRSAAAVKGIISEGIERAMGRFNRAP
jgi:peptidyl-tRNA hydrolase